AGRRRHEERWHRFIQPAPLHQPLRPASRPLTRWNESSLLLKRPRPMNAAPAFAFAPGPAQWGPALTRAGYLSVVGPWGTAYGLWQNPAPRGGRRRGA